MRPCTCDKADCHLCTLYRTRADYRGVWDAPPGGMSLDVLACKWRGGAVAGGLSACYSPMAAFVGGVSVATCAGCKVRNHSFAESFPAARTSPCEWLGGPTGGTAECLTCGGKTRLKVFACALHGSCTTDPKRHAQGVQSCDGCGDYRPRGRPLENPTRHLLYHVYPVGPAWRRNLDQLVRRIDLFNGRRVVAIAVGRKTEPAQAVRDHLKGHVHEFVEVRNDPRLREVKTFVPLFERVATAGPNEVTFYAHTKGAQYGHDPGSVTHSWADLMYEVCLDYWPLVAEALRHRPLAGAIKKIGAGFGGSRSRWHYSGSFCWFRSADVFSKPGWRQIDRQFWGIESWPSLHFGVNEAAALFHEGPVSDLDLYRPDVWRGVAEQFASWKRANEKHRTEAVPC